MYFVFWSRHLATYYYNVLRPFYFITFTVLCFIFCHEVQVRETYLTSRSLFS